MIIYASKKGKIEEVLLQWRSGCVVMALKTLIAIAKEDIFKVQRQIFYLRLGLNEFMS